MMIRFGPPSPVKPGEGNSPRDPQPKPRPPENIPDMGEKIKELDIDQLPPLRIKIVPDEDKKGVTWHLN